MSRLRADLVRAASASGAIAQLVERLNGIQEVSGSTPLSSTMKPPRETAGASSHLRRMVRTTK
jgi:hypothetical protein